MVKYLLLTLAPLLLLAFSSPIVMSMRDGTKRSVVLKENIVGGANTLTQGMLDKYGANTKFIIKYDYTLGEDIIVPDNSVIQFKGGSLRDGTVDFNYGRVISKRKSLFNVRFSHLPEIDINLFEIPQDATELLQDIVNSSNNIDLANKTFNIHKVVHVEGKGGEFNIKNGTINALNNFEQYEGERLAAKGMLLHLYDVQKGTVENLTLNGKRYAQRGLYLDKCNDIVIDHCDVYDFDGTDKASSWGIRCENSTNVKLINSYIRNIYALPVGNVGFALGSATGVMFEHTYNSCIQYNTIENVQSTKDGDALHIISIPKADGKPAPSRGDLYKDVNVLVSQNVIRANDKSKRCIKIQAFGVTVDNNIIQKLYVNRTNAVSIYGSNVTVTNNHIECEDFYTFSLGTSSLSQIHDVVIRNNTIDCITEREWCSCIYMIGSNLKDVLIESNTVNISNQMNAFCDLRESLDSVVLRNNIVKGGSYLFRVAINRENSKVENLQLVGNHHGGGYGLLDIEKVIGVITTFQDIVVEDNVFTGSDNTNKTFKIANIPEIKRNIHVGNNRSNKSMEL